MQFHPQFLFTTQFINMCTHEVSVEDVPQRNELVVDEGGSQNISEAVEEPPAKRFQKQWCWKHWSGVLN